MPRHCVRATSGDGSETRFVIIVEPEGDHFVARCEAPAEESQAAMPRFYGETPENALRRMAQTLENSYDDIEPIADKG
ncbi:hypothetical protein Pan216_22150 [Planctomycetes bacterium Pan216]|uniref:Uncharacterized protein n=1 Tax=Kolteria novifilia TaxID=2527975 RepID=A0A518B2Z3_9BACT|nr:hypothetical protein Pan216_22150 [Planctomycetes bacterium Pan216]